MGSHVDMIEMVTVTNDEDPTSQTPRICIDAAETRIEYNNLMGSTTLLLTPPTRTRGFIKWSSLLELTNRLNTGDHELTHLYRHGSTKSNISASTMSSTTAFQCSADPVEVEC